MLSEEVLEDRKEHGVGGQFRTFAAFEASAWGTRASCTGFMCSRGGAADAGQSGQAPKRLS